MIASEMDGVVKTGGLADFVAALPKALIARGDEVRVILPKYKNAIFPSSFKSESLYFNLNHSTYYGCLVHYANMPVHYDNGVDSEVLTSNKKTNLLKSCTIPVRLVEHNDFFSRDGIYDDGVNPYQDNPLRYAFFCKAALEQCINEQWIPDIIHCNDWQTALLPYYLKEHYTYNHSEFQKTKTVLTIHNGEYQGITDKKWLDSIGILPERFTSELMEEYGLLNILKCGIMYADAINAVSPGYAQELLQPESSHKNLWLYLNKRRDNFTGIINGCDYTLWNPNKDPFIPHHFSAKNLAGKNLCKIALKSRMGLQSNIEFSETYNLYNNSSAFKQRDIPLFGLVSRLVTQKGFDYLLPALEKLLYENAPIQIAMLGSGEHYYGSWIHHLEKRYPNKMSFVNGYDNTLSHLIEAGSDFFLMPSLFEPCGLNQLYSLVYGTIPIIRETGGLKDTVIPLTAEDMLSSKVRKKKKTAFTQATGISFIYPDISSCYEAIKQAITLYFDYRTLYLEMQKRAMQQRFTWDESAKQYKILYKTTSRY